MANADFSFVFDGEAVRDGEIDVTDLAPALLALGQAVKATGKIILGPDADISLKIKTVKHGSFEVFLNAVADGNLGLAWSMIKSFYASDDGQTAKAVIETLALGGGAAKTGAHSVIYLIKLLKGRKIISQEKIDGDNVRISVDGEDIVVPLRIAQVAQDPTVRNAIEKVIADPLEKDGIESVVFKDEEKTTVIEKHEGHYFKAAGMADTEFSSIYKKAFSIQALSFKKGNKWKLNDGQGSRNVTILDQEFMDKVDRSEISFSKNDVIVCDVKEIASRTQDGFKSQYEILKVIEHRPKSHQSSML